MGLIGITRLLNRRVKKDRKIYDAFWIYLPREITSDSQFPFKENDEIAIELDPLNKTLFIRKLEETETHKSKNK